MTVAGSHEVGSTRPELCRRLLPALVVGLAIVFAFVGLYTSALHDPTPNGLRVAVAGSSADARDVQHALDRGVPGGFDVRRYESVRAARSAVMGQDAEGAYLPARARLLLAGADGPSTGAALRTAFTVVAAAHGRRLLVADLRPLPGRDSRGLASFYAIAGLTIAGIAFAALLLFAGGPLPSVARIAATVAFAAPAGLVVALTGDTLIGALTGSFWGTAGTAALLALAVALPAAGLSRLLGAPGVGLAALVMVFLGLSTSGGPVGFRFLPDFYNALSQRMPSGAALTALRNTVYFDGASTRGPVLVLVAWAAGGLVLELLAALRRRPGPAIELDGGAG